MLLLNLMLYMYKRQAPSSRKEIQELNCSAKVSAYPRFTNKTKCKKPSSWARLAEQVMVRG